MFEALNNKYYALFSDLYTSRAVLPPKQYEQMAEALMAEYRREREVLVGNIQLDVAQSTFELRYRLKKYVPKRGLFGLNKIGKVLRKRLDKDFKLYLKSLEDSHEETEAADNPPQEDPPDLHPVAVSADPPTPTE